MAEPNIYEALANENLDAAPVAPPEAPKSEAIDYTKLSDKPVGEKENYERVNLDGQTVTIKGAEVHNADRSEPPITALSDSAVKYYKANFIVHYDTPNDDREYYSGVTQFVQKDGSLSQQSFWYAGAKNQTAQLWEKVAAFKNKKPEELSPREFLSFLNNKPKAVIKNTPVMFKNEVFNKNLVEKFVA